MKILVTGGAGFLGSHVTDALTDAGHDVVVFDRTSSPYLRKEQTMIVGDVLDRDAVHAALDGVDAVYHFAAIADIDEAIDTPVRTIEVNVMGTLNMLEAARQRGVRRFIFASSIYVYSQQGAFYRTSKQAAEKLIEDYRERFGLSYTILRFGSLYGPRADQTNAVHRMIRSAMESREIGYGGTGEEIREYIHVVDGAQAAVDVLAAEYENDIIHLTGHERMTTRDMMEMIAEILGGGIKINVNSGRLTGHYLQTPYSYMPKRGRKLVRGSYIDIGLGLLDVIEHHQNENLGD